MKNASNLWNFKKDKTQMYAIIDVSIERLAQHFDDHVLTICLKNLRVEPLIEINHIKSRLTYLTIQLVDMNYYNRNYNFFS